MTEIPVEQLVEFCRALMPQRDPRTGELTDYDRGRADTILDFHNLIRYCQRPAKPAPARP